jgi:tetraacyldisaccharide 4'-kinase
MASGRHRAEQVWQDAAARAPLLAAASLVYGAGRSLHRGLFDAGVLKRRRLDALVVSVGNLTVGGVGKTPFVAWLAKELLARGRKVVALARGYGRRDGARLNDEGLWLEREVAGLRVVQDPDRFAVAQVALATEPADVVLLDDGFQHERLERDLDVVLLDARAPFGNGRLLPRGPLRERPEAIARAHFVLAARAELADVGQLERLRAEVARLAPHARFGALHFEVGAVRRAERRDEPATLRGRAVVLCTGVGSPASVRATVERLGARVVDELVFPDHHDFTRDDLARAREAARSRDAELVVTAKDAVKLDLLSGATSVSPRRAAGDSSVADYAVLEQEVDAGAAGAELLAAVESRLSARVSGACAP